MAMSLRAFTINACAPGMYHVTCWNEDHTSCGVQTYYDPGFSPWSDPMLLTENVKTLEASGRINMTGHTFNPVSREWQPLLPARAF